MGKLWVGIQAVISEQPDFIQHAYAWQF